MVKESVDSFWKFLPGNWHNRTTTSDQRLCQGHTQRTAALGRQPVQSAHWFFMGSHGERRLGSARWVWHLQQLVDPSQRAGGIPRKPARRSCTDLLRGWDSFGASSHFCSRKQQQGPVWIYVPDFWAGNGCDTATGGWA